MVMLDLACLTSGTVNVMIPANSVPEHISYILNQAKSAVIFADDEKQLSKIRSVKKDLEHLKTVVMVNGNAADDWIISFNEFKALKQTAMNPYQSPYRTRIACNFDVHIRHNRRTEGNNVLAYEHCI
jgi:long-subunit acyl-CoA synthetase (AMP-forming)